MQFRLKWIFVAILVVAVWAEFTQLFLNLMIEHRLDRHPTFSDYGVCAYFALLPMDFLFLLGSAVWMQIYLIRAKRKRRR